MATELVEISWQGQGLNIEHVWLGRHRQSAPWLIFLHEGLGSVAMWKDFPARLCDALQCRGLVYSRPGYGRSGAPSPSQPWGGDFLHQQAHTVLPALLAALAIDATQDPPWLLGHSDGGSIALLFAARFVDQVAGVIALAPHILVEDCTVASIEAARCAYRHDDLRARLARYHDHPDLVFGGWSGVWLSSTFKPWSIAEEISNIRCPLLAVQGLDDEYGTLEQVRGIARALPQTRLLVLPECGHAPQRDQPDALVAAVCEWMGAQPGSRFAGVV